MLILLLALQMYAEAIADGHGGEAGF